jgi:response regulator RpfG family c-di-GMP phosphodiesterase
LAGKVIEKSVKAKHMKQHDATEFDNILPTIQYHLATRTQMQIDDAYYNRIVTELIDLKERARLEYFENFLARMYLLYPDEDFLLGITKVPNAIREEFEYRYYQRLMGMGQSIFDGIDKLLRASELLLAMDLYPSCDRNFSLALSVARIIEKYTSSTRHQGIAQKAHGALQRIYSQRMYSALYQRNFELLKIYEDEFLAIGFEPTMKVRLYMFIGKINRYDYVLKDPVLKQEFEREYINLIKQLEEAAQKMLMLEYTYFQYQFGSEGSLTLALQVLDFLKQDAEMRHDDSALSQFLLAEAIFRNDNKILLECLDKAVASENYYVQTGAMTHFFSKYKDYFIALSPADIISRKSVMTREFFDFLIKYDQYTFGEHTGFVAKYSPILLSGVYEQLKHDSSYKWADDDADLIECAAWFHDIGKAPVKKATLHKSGKIFGNELNELRSHAGVFGFELAQHLGFFEIAAYGLYHHENYSDNRGYPAHVALSTLSDKKLSLFNLVISCIDKFNVAWLGRNYCPAKSEEEIEADFFSPEMRGILSGEVQDAFRGLYFKLFKGKPRKRYMQTVLEKENAA